MLTVNWTRARTLIAAILMISGASVASGDTGDLPTQQEVMSLRDVFGIDAPDAQGDATERLRRRSQAPDLMPRTDGEIPDVSERDSGPRIIVKKFVFERLEEFPDFDITREGVEAEAERLRVIYMKEDRRRKDGYTPEEVNEITGYLKDIGSQSAVDDLTHEDMQALVDLVREQNRNRGLSFADLEEVANRLTQYYRKRGLFLARVLLPAQEVEDGIVTFSVMEGRLGQIEPVNNEWYEESTLRSPLEPMVGDIVTSREIEEALYLLNDLPGLTLSGAFSAGDNPGETRLKLIVREEDNMAFLVRMDNHGANFTGKARLFLNMQMFNPIGFGDSLSLGFLRSEDFGDNNSDEGVEESVGSRDAHSNLGQFNYSFPVFSLRNRLSFSADRNTFDLVDENGSIINALEISGVNTSYALAFNHQFTRTRDFNFAAGIAATKKGSRVDSYIPFLSTEDKVVGGELNFYIDALTQSGVRMLNTASLTLQRGRFQTEVGEGEDETFNKAVLLTNSLFFVPLPFTDQYSRLLTTLRVQYSSQILPSFEQFGLGGANAVRSYQVGDFSADKALFLSNEWYFNLPAWQVGSGKTINDVFQAGLLFDFGYGIQNGGFTNDSGSVADDEWARLSAAGLVFKASWDKHFSSKLSIATPLEGVSSLDPSDDNDSVEKIKGDSDAIEIFADINFYF